MAGSIGALADKYGTQMGLIWKSLLVVIGLPAVYFVMEKDYKLGTLLAVLTLVLVILPLINKEKKEPKADIFKHCCE